MLSISFSCESSVLIIASSLYNTQNLVKVPYSSNFYYFFIFYFYFFFGVPHLATFIFNFFINVIASKSLTSIQNTVPLGHEPSVLTTRPVVPNLFWLVEHLSPGKVLAEHFRPKKPLTEHLNPKILHFYMNFKVSKNLAEHLGPACGTLVFRGTVVGNHCTRPWLIASNFYYSFIFSPWSYKIVQFSICFCLWHSDTE